MKTPSNIDRQYPTKKSFLWSKNEWYGVVDLVTAINNNIGFRVCKWTGVPEKHVQSFAFYLGDSQPKHAEKVFFYQGKLVLVGYCQRFN